jgi:hypothetical protein
VDPEATPLKVPMAPTRNGVPLALVPPAVGPALAVADAAPVAAPVDAPPELDDAEEQPAAVSVVRASAVMVMVTRPGLRPRWRPVCL